jgi:hypothetical protein
VATSHCGLFIALRKLTRSCKTDASVCIGTTTIPLSVPIAVVSDACYPWPKPTLESRCGIRAACVNHLVTIIGLWSHRPFVESTRVLADVSDLRQGPLSKGAVLR